MRSLLTGWLVCLAFGALGTAAAQVPAAAGKFITLDFVVADVAEGAAAIPTAAAVLELEKAGKLSGLAKFRLTALENQQAMLQFGERVPLVTGRSGGFGGGRGGDFAQGGAVYSQASIGTMITAVARVDGSGDVIADVKFERSSVAPRPADPAEANAAAPQGTNTVSVQTSVRVKPGEPLLVGGRQTGGKDTAQTWIVLTASVAAGPEKKAAAVDSSEVTGIVASVDDSDDKIKIMQVVNASAPALAKVLSEIFSQQPVRIAVDARTNSLLVRGPAADLEIMRAVVLHLDAVRETP